MKPSPRLFTLDTADAWLHTHQRDLHLIMKAMRPASHDPWESEFICPMADNLLPAALDDWLKTELPDTPVGIVRKLVVHSKHYWQAWFIPWVDFSPQGLAHYAQYWESARQLGRGGRFWRKTLNYPQWRAELSNHQVCDQPRNTPASVLWFDTPIGLLWSPWPDTDDCTQKAHRQHMTWLRAQALYPVLASLELKQVVSGYLLPNNTTPGDWLCIAELPHQASFMQQQALEAQYAGESATLTPRQKAICRFLAVPEGRATFSSNGWG